MKSKYLKALNVNNDLKINLFSRGQMVLLLFNSTAFVFTTFMLLYFLHLHS